VSKVGTFNTDRTISLKGRRAYLKIIIIIIIIITYQTKRNIKKIPEDEFFIALRNQFFACAYFGIFSSARVGIIFDTVK
jgi:hypothetical protein